MKILVKIVGFCFLMILFSKCEKDDLCAGNDNQTPRLHGKIYDQFAPTSAKAIDLIKIYEPGNDKKITFTNTSEFYIPLAPNSGNAIWIIEIYDVNQNTETLLGQETLIFTYNPVNKYISKACGYKTEYQGFSYVKEAATNPWMAGINLTTNNITSENDVHIQIFY